MITMEIKGKNYQVTYDPATTTVTFSGPLRLRSAEYAAIEELLNDVAAQKPKTITLNLCDLSFLNSSGIATLTMFVIKLNQQGGSQLTIQASNDHRWQARSLKNMAKMMPTLTLEWL